jgi:hypothetical protein
MEKASSGEAAARRRLLAGLAIGLAAGLAAGLPAGRSLSARRLAGEARYSGLWASPLNGVQGVESYLVLEPLEDGYLLLLADPGKGELSGAGKALRSAKGLEAALADGSGLSLELAGPGELRVVPKKDRQTEDYELFFVRLAGSRR